MKNAIISKHPRNAYLRGSCSWPAGPAGRPGWAQLPASRRCPDAMAAPRVPTAVWRWSVAAASSPARSPAAAEGGPRVDGEEDCGPVGRYSVAAAARRPAALLQTSTDRRHPTVPDDTLLPLVRCSPPGGFRHPPAVVRTASTAPV